MPSLITSLNTPINTAIAATGSLTVSALQQLRANILYTVDQQIAAALAAAESGNFPSVTLTAPSSGDFALLHAFFADGGGGTGLPAALTAVIAAERAGVGSWSTLIFALIELAKVVSNNMKDVTAAAGGF